MVVFRNFDVHTRVWPGLQRADGRTLELEPDEECELDLPETFADEHLRAVPRRRLTPLKREDVVPSSSTDEAASRQSSDDSSPKD